MNNDFLFYEDARKYKKGVMVGLIVFILVTLAFLLNLIIQIKNKNLNQIILYLILFLIALLFVFYLIYALNSKYLKNYIFITSTYIEFYSKTGKQKFETNAFSDFKVIKDKQHYAFFELIIGNQRFEVFSFKPKEITKVLQDLKNHK